MCRKHKRKITTNRCISQYRSDSNSNCEKVPYTIIKVSSRFKIITLAMMNTNYNASTAYQNSNSGHPSRPSAPVYMDLLSDDSYYQSSYQIPTSTTTTSQPPHVVTPTASAVYMPYSPTVANFPSSTSSASTMRASNATTSGNHGDKVVMIPSNSVFVEQQNLVTTMSTSPPSSSTPVYSYNDDNNYYREEETSPYESRSSSNNYHNSNEYDSNSSHYTNNETAVATLHDPDQSQQRYFKGKPVKPKHAHLPDSVLAFKAERKRRTVMATCTGGAVGFIALGPVFGPVGAVIGATSAYAAAKTVGKHRERKITEHAILQQNYLSSSIRDENAVPSTSTVQESTGSSLHYSSTSGGNIRSMANIPIDRAEVA